MTTVRHALAAVLALLAVAVGVFAWRLPMEAGGLVFGPMLLGLAGLLVAGAIGLAAPRRAREPRQITQRDVALFLGLLGVLGLAQVVQWIV